MFHSLLRSSIIGGFRRERDRERRGEGGILGWRVGVKRRREPRRIGEEVSDDGFVAAANGSLPARFRFQFPLLIAVGQLPDPQRDTRRPRVKVTRFETRLAPCLRFNLEDSIWRWSRATRKTGFFRIIYILYIIFIDPFARFRESDITRGFTTELRSCGNCTRI